MAAICLRIAIYETLPFDEFSVNMHIRGLLYHSLRADSMIKKSGFWINTRPDFKPEGSGASRVGFAFPGVGVFRLGSPLGAKLVGRIGFQIFEFFDHPRQ